MDNQKRTENSIDRAEAMTKMLAENVKSDEEDIYIKVSAVVQLLRELSSVNSQHSGDLISREKTLTAFADYVGSGMSMDDYDALWDIVAKMPAVKQEPRFIAKSDGTIEQIKECTEQEPCEDTISRQAAIDAVDSETVSANPEHFKSSEKFIKFMDDADIANFGKWQWANGFNTAVVAAKIQLEKLPPVNPTKTGHWISHYDEDAKEGWYECDRCHTERAFNTDYCPDCGARMVEPQERRDKE